MTLNVLFLFVTRTVSGHGREASCKTLRCGIETMYWVKIDHVMVKMARVVWALPERIS